VKRTVRLDRALSKLGAASRSQAFDLIRSGRVTVAGRVVTDPAYGVVPEVARLAIDRRAIRRAGWRTLAFHKPRGIVTSRRDPDGRQTVFDVIGPESAGLVTVGRLDLASTGLLLLTNDTRLANWLTDPASAVVRRYVVTVRGAVTDQDAADIEHGIAGLRATKVVIRKRSQRETHLIVELNEGRNREIRRLFDAVGHDVTRLLRVAYGPIELNQLKPGEWREISVSEMRAAFPGAGIR
jgi:23S rRNA pseudouridine2605 synthase